MTEPYDRLNLFVSVGNPGAVRKLLVKQCGSVRWHVALRAQQQGVILVKSAEINPSSAHHPAG